MMLFAYEPFWHKDCNLSQVCAILAQAPIISLFSKYQIHPQMKPEAMGSIPMALPLQATDCGDTIQLVRGLTPLIPRLKGEMNMKKRIHEIKIRFSPDEFATLNEQVKKAGISREQNKVNTHIDGFLGIFHGGFSATGHGPHIFCRVF